MYAVSGCDVTTSSVKCSSMVALVCHVVCRVVGAMGGVLTFDAGALWMYTNQQYMRVYACVKRCCYHTVSIHFVGNIIVEL